jgi:hypothetical protein
LSQVGGANGAPGAGRSTNRVRAGAGSLEPHYPRIFAEAK